MLVVRGAPEAAGPGMTEDEALALVAEYEAGGMRRKDACRRAAQESGYAANALYRRAVDAEKEN